MVHLVTHHYLLVSLTANRAHSKPLLSVCVTMWSLVTYLNIIAVPMYSGQVRFINFLQSMYKYICLYFVLFDIVSLQLHIFRH